MPSGGGEFDRPGESFSLFAGSTPRGLPSGVADGSAHDFTTTNKAVTPRQVAAMLAWAGFGWGDGIMPDRDLLSLAPGAYIAANGLNGLPSGTGAGILLVFSSGDGLAGAAPASSSRGDWRFVFFADGGSVHMRKGSPATWAEVSGSDEYTAGDEIDISAANVISVSQALRDAVAANTNKTGLPAVPATQHGGVLRSYGPNRVARWFEGMGNLAHLKALQAGENAQTGVAIPGGAMFREGTGVDAVVYVFTTSVLVSDNRTVAQLEATGEIKRLSNLTTTQLNAAIAAWIAANPQGGGGGTYTRYESKTRFDEDNTTAFAIGDTFEIASGAGAGFYYVKVAVAAATNFDDIPAASLEHLGPPGATAAQAAAIALNTAKHGLYEVHASAVGVWRGVMGNPDDSTVLSAGTTQFDGGAIYLSRTDATGAAVSVDDLPAVGGAITFAEISTTVAAKSQNANRIKLTLAGSNQPLAAQGVKYQLFNTANPSFDQHGIYVDADTMEGTGDPANPVGVKQDGITARELADDAVEGRNINNGAIVSEKFDMAAGESRTPGEAVVFRADGKIGSAPFVGTESDNDFVDATIAETALTFVRRSGTNPVVINLPTSGGGSESTNDVVGASFNTANNTLTLVRRSNTNPITIDLSSLVDAAETGAGIVAKLAALTGGDRLSYTALKDQLTGANGVVISGGAVGLKAPAAWAANTQYARDERATHGGELYLARADISASSTNQSPDLDTARWWLLSGSGSGGVDTTIYKGAHSRTSAYSVGDEVLGDDGKFYKNKVAVAAGATTQNGTWSDGNRNTAGQASLDGQNGLETDPQFCFTTQPTTAIVAGQTYTLRFVPGGAATSPAVSITGVATQTHGGNPSCWRFGSYADMHAAFGNAPLGSVSDAKFHGGTWIVEQTTQNAKPQDDAVNWQLLGDGTGSGGSGGSYTVFATARAFDDDNTTSFAVGDHFRINGSDNPGLYYVQVAIGAGVDFDDIPAASIQRINDTTAALLSAGIVAALDDGALPRGKLEGLNSPAPGRMVITGTSGLDTQEIPSGGAAIASDAEFETGTETTKAPNVAQVQGRIAAVESVLAFWDGTTAPNLDVNKGTNATVLAGSSVLTPYDAANDRLILSQGGGAANQVSAYWQNAAIDWNNFAMAFKVERPAKHDGFLCMAFMGCNPAALPTLPQSHRAAGGFALEINRATDNAHNLGAGGGDWLFGFVPYGASGQEAQNGRLVPDAFYNGAGVGLNSAAYRYVRLPNSFNNVSEVAVVLVRAGKLIKFYANGTHYATWRLTQAQQDRATFSAYGFYGGDNNANGHLAYLKEVGVGNPDMEMVEESFRVGAGEEFTSALKTKLDGIEVGATADQTAAQIVAGLQGLSGSNRLDYSAIKNAPDDHWLGDWTTLANGTAIADGNRIVYNGEIYTSLTNHTKGATTPDADTTNWKQTSADGGYSTAAQVRDALAGLSGAARLSYTNLKDGLTAGSNISIAGGQVSVAQSLISEIAANTLKRTYPQADQNRLAAMEDNATADQTGAEMKTALEGLSGDARLDASAIKNLPSGQKAYRGAWSASANPAYGVGDYVSRVINGETRFFVFTGGSQNRAPDGIVAEWRELGEIIAEDALYDNSAAPNLTSSAQTINLAANKSFVGWNVLEFCLGVSATQCITSRISGSAFRGTEHPGAKELIPVTSIGGSYSGVVIVHRESDTSFRAAYYGSGQLTDVKVRKITGIKGV